MNLKEIAISVGSACTTQMVEPSHVLLAFGLDEDTTHHAIRMGRFNTIDEIQKSKDMICSSVQSLKRIKI